MLTLTVILLHIMPGFNFYYVLIIAMVLDLIFSLYIFFLFERQKKTLDEKHTAIVSNYKSEQARLEDIIEEFQEAQSTEENKKGIIGYNLKEQQELRDKLDRSLKEQREQKAEIENYKTRIEEYRKKIKAQEKEVENYRARAGIIEDPEKVPQKDTSEDSEDPLMAKLQPVPQEIKM